MNFKMAYKPLWDFMDKLEGKPKGTSIENLKREMKRQGYNPDKIITGERKAVMINKNAYLRCEFCGKPKIIGKPCICDVGAVFG